MLFLDLTESRPCWLASYSTSSSLSSFRLLVFRVTFSSGIPLILLRSVMPVHLSPRLSLSRCCIVNNGCFSSLCVPSRATDHVACTLCHSAESSAGLLRRGISTYRRLWSSEHSLSVWEKEVCKDRRIMLETLLRQNIEKFL